MQKVYPDRVDRKARATENHNVWPKARHNQVPQRHGIEFNAFQAFCDFHNPRHKNQPSCDESGKEPISLRVFGRICVKYGSESPSPELMHQNQGGQGAALRN